MSKIEWCDITWNVAWGCSYGCNFCYARKISYRFAEVIARREAKFSMYDEDSYLRFYNQFEEELANFEFTVLKSQFKVKFRKKPAIIFANSMFDIADLTKKRLSWEKFISKVEEYPQHTFIVLTKRPKELLDIYFPENMIVGVSCINQSMYEKNAPVLMQISAERKLISFEPLWGNIELNPKYPVDWVICGGETGNKTRYGLTAEVARSLQAQCAELEIPFFFKSWGAKIPEGQEKGKIDGVEYQEFFKK